MKDLSIKQAGESVILDDVKSTVVQLYKNSQLFDSQSLFTVVQLYTIVVDRLELSLYDSPIVSNKEPEKYVEVGRFVLRHLGSGGKWHKARYQVSINFEDQGEQLFAYLHTNAVAKETAGNTSQLILENNFFYTEGWIELLKELLSELNTEVKHVTRLDIAIDGKNLLEVIEAILALQDKGCIHKVGSVKKFNFDKDYKGQEQDTEIFHWGKKTADKNLKAYRKSEVIEKDNKQYIRQFWGQNGVKDTENVDRAEITLRSKEAKKYDDSLSRVVDENTGEIISGFSLEALEDTATLAGIFRAAIAGWFEFRDTSSKNVSRCKKLEIFDFDFFNAKEITKVSKTNTPSATANAKRLAKSIIKTSAEEQKEIEEELVNQMLLNDLMDKPKSHGILDAIVAFVSQKYDLSSWVTLEKLKQVERSPKIERKHLTEKNSIAV